VKAILLALLLVASSCETTQYIPAAVDAKVDSALRAAGIGPLQAGKIKIAGNVIINTGPGAVQVADNRQAGQKQGSAATGPASQAATTAKPAGQPWLAFAVIALVGVVAGAWLRGKLPRLPFLG
jgi:hypothetical protein